MSISHVLNTAGDKPAVCVASLIVELRPNGAKTRGVDLVGLPVFRADETLASQLLKNEKRAVRQKKTFAGVAIDSGDAALVIVHMDDATAFREDVERPLLWP
jgi:hypothetical protein